MSFVEGSYATPQEAIKAVEKLQKEGYKKESIRLVSSSAARTSFLDQTDLDVTTEYKQSDMPQTDTNEDDRSMWEKIKDAFTEDDYDTNVSTGLEDDPLYSYQEDIANGNIIVVVDGEPDMKPSPEMPHPTETDAIKTNDKTIQLKEERLDVGTKEVQTGDVNITKRVTEETESVEVPVKHEEIVIERHKVADGTTSDADLKDEEIVIPVSEEQIEVTKHPVVTEEVSIGKEVVEEKKQVSERVKKEDLDVHSEGDVRLDEENGSNKSK